MTGIGDTRVDALDEAFDEPKLKALFVLRLSRRRLPLRDVVIS